MKKRWIVLLLVLAVILIGSGFYFRTEPGWTDKTNYGYYNEGMAAYQNGDIEKSTEEFSYVSASSKDNWLKSLALFQSSYLIIGEQVFNGNLSPRDRIEIAIVLLEEAVVSDPKNEEAKYNLELLISHLSKLSQEMQEGESDKGQPQPGPNYGPGGGDRGY